MVHVLENEWWQVGILPETGAATAFGRVKRGGEWVDVLRPTAESAYGNSSLCSSFVMLPWANRIRDARFRFRGKDYQLQPNDAEGTARHGVARRLGWDIGRSSREQIVTRMYSTDYPDLNFPFRFSAEVDFHLEGSGFVMALTLTNEDTQPFPAGFGHHPYFVRDAANAVQVQICADARFELVDAMVSAPPVPVTPEQDFRQLRPLGTAVYEDLYTARHDDLAARIVYPDVALSMIADRLFEQILLFAPEGKPFFAIEPQTNANDGFNLAEQGVKECGVFVLEPGESKSGTVVLKIDN